MLLDIFLEWWEKKSIIRFTFNKILNDVLLLYNFLNSHKWLFLFLLYSVWLIYQFFALGPVINDYSVFYYLDISLSIIFFSKLFIFILWWLLLWLIIWWLWLILWPFFAFIWILLTFLYWIIWAYITDGFVDFFSILFIFIFFLLNYFFYFKNTYFKVLFLSFFFYVCLIIWLLNSFNTFNPLTSEPSKIEIVFQDNSHLKWELHFYNWSFYFITHEKNWKIIKEIINDKFVKKIYYK